MKKTNLLLIAPSFYPVHGGAGLRFFRYLPLFHEHNIDVTVICGTPKLKKFTAEDHQATWINMSDGELVSEVEIESAKILKYKVPGAKAKYRIKVLLDKALMLCKNESTRPDVVHIIAPMPFEVIKQLRQLKKYGLRLVYSQTIAREYSSKFLVKKLQLLKVKKVNECYDSIIVQSEALKKIVIDTNKKADVHIIPNGVDTHKFAPLESDEEKKRLRTKLNLPVDAKLITLVGAVHPRKGTDVLIEAWSTLVRKRPDIHLILIGPRYDLSHKELKQFKRTMEQRIEGSGKKANIHFLGQVDNVNEYLQVSDLFVFPSKREGMPNAVLEAMSSGLAVILTPFIGLSKEMGNEGSEYLLSQRSSDALASNILSVLESDALQNNLAKRARHWIVNHMDVAASVKAHENLYKQMLI